MPALAPFVAIRPRGASAAAMVCPPYDVVDTAAARALLREGRNQFLHLTHPEVDCETGCDPTDPRVYAAAAERLRRWLEDGTLVRDARPSYTVYRETGAGHVQTGLVGCVDVAAYRAGRIKRHEVTLVEKERDRSEHFRAVGAQTEPIWLAHRDDRRLEALLDEATAARADYDVTDQAGVRHQAWVEDDPATVARIAAAFGTNRDLYIADGHHRAASAAAIDAAGRTGIMAVAFPAGCLRILDYNRVVTDLGGLDEDALVRRARELGWSVTPAATAAPVLPRERAVFGMWLAGAWYTLRPAAAALAERSGAAALDVALLHDLLLRPGLGITDPRTDARISFVGGGAGPQALVELAGRTGGAAFTVPPVTMETIMDVADRGQIMPPKSTWFEPKLGSGLFLLPYA